MIEFALKAAEVFVEDAQGYDGEAGIDEGRFRRDVPAPEDDARVDYVCVPMRFAEMLFT